MAVFSEVFFNLCKFFVMIGIVRMSCLHMSCVFGFVPGLYCIACIAICFEGGHLRVFTDEESNFAALLQRAMDLEGIDRDVVYQLVALLMNVCFCNFSLKTLFA